MNQQPDQGDHMDKTREKETKQSEVFVDRAWVGLGPGLDRSRSEPAFFCMFQFGCIVTRKGRRGGPAASGQLHCLSPCATVATWLPDSLPAWELHSLPGPTAVAKCSSAA